MSVRDALDEPTEPITFLGYVMLSRSQDSRYPRRDLLLFKPWPDFANQANEAIGLVADKSNGSSNLATLGARRLSRLNYRPY